MKPLHLVTCSHCGGAHSHEAHHDPAYAVRLADEALAKGAINDGRMWIGVARKLLKEKRR
jgi:hypothetical protein